MHHGKYSIKREISKLNVIHFHNQYTLSIYLMFMINNILICQVGFISEPQ